MKLNKTTEVTSILHGVYTPLVTPCLQHPTWRFNTHIYNVQKTFEHSTSCSFIKKKSVMMKFYFEIN